jgi:hypothetical protein
MRWAVSVGRPPGNDDRNASCTKSAVSRVTIGFHASSRRQPSGSRVRGSGTYSRAHLCATMVSIAKRRPSNAGRTRVFSQTRGIAPCRWSRRSICGVPQPRSRLYWPTGIRQGRHPACRVNDVQSALPVAALRSSEITFVSSTYIRTGRQDASMQPQCVVAQIQYPQGQASPAK